MLLTERRFPALGHFQWLNPFIALGGKPPAPESRLEAEIQRCRSMVQASKAERMYLGAEDQRRVF
ncbi:hypothetical protein GT347_26745 [Xylophilus rhododendri]|uniref:Uncharacterized protein n=1 Tax=Xylophilus rhododendri TaxID=2697032 RepID=A0A857JB75_9BURK|nr:hypothetical protein [Xylophilus rhododendri]QHJ01271.1 hypothetical protein GT347_26745 [Xylophilus rhododendri]